MIGRYVDELGIEHQYGNERITTPRKLTSLLTDTGFTDITVNRFRTLPNVDVPSCVIRAETKLVAVAPFLATHFNLCARKPI